MKKNILELTIDKITFGGEALASYQGKKIFIPWGVPGDRVRVELIQERNNFSRAKILEILDKSPHRESPPCPYFFKCGGCQWQHIRYESQLQFKATLLKETLERIGKIPHPTLLEPLAAPRPYHYRNRIRLQVSRQGEVGFFRGRSKDLIPIEQCLIAHPALNEKIPEAKGLAGRLLQKDPAKRHEIEIRLVGEESAQVGPSLCESARFLQVNEAQNNLLIERVLDSLELEGTESILELYAGEGNFTFPLAKRAKSIVAVESSENSFKEAQERIRQEHRRNIRFVQSTAYRFLENSLVSPLEEARFNRLLLDPPRKGATECLEGIARSKIPLLIYISCDPATLARDIQILTRLGYRHDFSQVIDMFPQTYHVESVTRLKKRG